MSLRRSTRAQKTTSRKTNEASPRHDAQTAKKPLPVPCLDMDEAALRKLTRAELQKLAKANNIKANMKSNSIIEELVRLCKVVPLHQDEEPEEPPRKKSRTSLHDQTHSVSPGRARKESPPFAALPTQIMYMPKDTSRESYAPRSFKKHNTWPVDPVTVPEGSPKYEQTAQNTAPTLASGNAADVIAANSAGTPQGSSPILESHKALEDDISDSGSDLSYPSKNGLYNSPVSSRAGTPPLEEPKRLQRTVKIMNQITADDQRILAQIAALRERATTLKEQAQKVRHVVRAEEGRRKRLEAYFTYWREIAPKWPQEWIYESKEERIRTEKDLNASRLLSPQSDTSGRAAKRKSRA